MLIITSAKQDFQSLLFVC